MDPQTAQQTPQPGIQEVHKPGSKTPMVILVVVLIIVLVVGAGFLLLKNKGDEGSGPKVIKDLEVASIAIGLDFVMVDVYPNNKPDFHEIVFSNNIFEGLARIIDGQVKPALATSWTNPDNTTWRFTLRKGVKFHNGDLLKASDVKFSIDTALAKEWPASFNFDTVESVTVVDDSTVDIKTAGPDPVLLNRLVFAFIVSEKQFKEKAETDKAVGTGPYKFISLDKEEAIIQANDNYYLGPPKVKKVVYKFFPDTTDSKMVEALNKGEIDLLYVDEPEAYKQVSANIQNKALIDPFITFLFVGTGDKSPNVDKTPNPFKNKLVRQAIYKVLNVDKIISEAGISAAPVTQLVSPDIFGYNPNITRTPSSVEEAKKLMVEAGEQDGFSMTIDTSNSRVKEAEALAKQLALINIKAKVNGVPDIYDKLGDTSVFIIGYSAETYDAGEIFTVLLHTADKQFGAGNFIGYSNPELDKLAEEIAVEFDLKKRQTKLQEAMVKAMEELPIIPLYTTEWHYLIRDNLEWTPTAFGAIYANEISGRQVTNQ